MIQAKDLMIGDWYAFRGHPYKCTANDIASLAECEEKGVPTDISEISLAPEILEKNRFRVVGDMFVFGEVDGALVRLTPTINNAYRIEIQVADLMMSYRGYCSYVHQLQHALRLCGIEKEIEL